MHYFIVSVWFVFMIHVGRCPCLLGSSRKAGWLQFPNDTWYVDFVPSSLTLSLLNSGPSKQGGTKNFQVSC